MPTKDIQSAILAGLLSSALFLVIYATGLGFIFMFTPTLPIFYVGLHHGVLTAARASLIAAALTFLGISLSSAVIFAILLGLPACYMTRYALKHTVSAQGTIRWYPIGMIIVNLSFYAVLFIGLMTAYYHSAPGGLQALIAQHVSGSIKELQAEYGEAMGLIAREWAFLIFPVTIWLWALCLYGHAWIATRMLQKAGKAKRPDFAVTPFYMPGWVLYLLGVSALASLIGSDSMKFFGKSSLIVLMLPYFFQGMALMHANSLNWPNRRFFLFIVYFLIIAQVWPALGLSALGIWEQLKTLNKHLPRGDSSSNN
jgi:hypothetical protein